MKEYLFSKEELKLTEFLKSKSPNKIWWEPISYIFEYNSFYIELGIKCAEKLHVDIIPDNEFENIITSPIEQYVMIAKLKKINRKFEPQKASELLVKNETIAEINIVRTLLIFCKYERSKENSNFFTTDSHQINPNLNIDEKLDVLRTYLVDVGLWIQTENKNINSFLIDNNDDFATNSYRYQNDNLKEIKKEIYNFISID